jgi:hypothetical protein
MNMCSTFLSPSPQAEGVCLMVRDVQAQTKAKEPILDNKGHHATHTLVIKYLSKRLHAHSRVTFLCLQMPISNSTV